MNSRKQGDIGTSFAITYFSIAGYNVSIPISDSQPYDLIVEKEGICYRVQVKTCFKKNKNKSYKLELRTVSNTRGKEFSISFISKKTCDLIFAVDGDCNLFVYPIEALKTKSSLTLNSEAWLYKVTIPTNLEKQTD